MVLEIGNIQSYKAEIDEQTLNTYIKQDRHAAHIKEKLVPSEGWRGCFQHFDGTIYLAGRNKSVDGGKTLVQHNVTNLDKISALQFIGIPTPNQIGNQLQPGPEGSVFSKPGLFLALDGRMYFDSPGVYHIRTWRSTDNLKNIEDAKVVVEIPEGPRRNRKPSEWFGLYVCRDILEMPDGTLIASAEGNFEEDNIVPTSGPGKKETNYLGRTFIISSKDAGQSWKYLSTVVAPSSDDPVDEGFGEPTLAHLNNGQLLCIMRTGHHRPLYACWSSDQGKSWTEPVYTGLERGCWPCLVKLADGRLALSYGVRYPAGWSRISPEGDHGRWVYPGKGLVKLAISPDGTGHEWIDSTIGHNLGSVYTTILETEPNVLFCQVDGWYWRVKLSPKNNQ